MMMQQQIEQRDTTKRVYVAIFLIALLLRLAYCFYLQQFMWGRFKFVDGDTSTYLDSFMNLIHYGRYCFDLAIKDSCFYRLPTYPFFLGINYLLFGKLAWVSVSVFQSIIDAVSCCLAFAIARSLNFDLLAQRVVAVLFVFYPFTIVWTPIQYPEILGVFLVLLAVYFIVDKKWMLAVIGGGAALVLAVWSKQYIAALLPVVIFFVAARPNPKKILGMCTAIYLSFALFYSPWPIRNYVNYGEWAPLGGKTTGCRHYLADFNAAMYFVSLFYENPKEELDGIISNGRLVLPSSKFVDAHRNEIDQAARLAFTTGPSFKTWRHESYIVNDESRAAEKKVADAFVSLSAKAKNEMKFKEYYRTGFEGFQKGFFKTTYTAKSGSSIIQALLFGYRGVLVIFGISAIFVARGRVRLFVLGVLLYWFSTLFVLSFIYRHVEMRYLLMSDMLLILCSGLTIGWIVNKVQILMGTKANLV
jgi:hypothetical protein